MELENTFVVPAGIEVAWAKLLDVESVAPCMPGATLTSRDADEFAGSVKVKLGPVSMVYNGTARFVEQDAAAHHAVIEAAGKDTKGTSTARASVRAQLTAESEGTTRVDVVTDLAITGRPAQFGRGVMQDVAGRIIDQFAANLAHVMGAETAPEAPPQPPAESVEAPAPAKKAAARRPSKKAAAKAPAAEAPPPEAAPDQPAPPAETPQGARLEAPLAEPAPVPKHELPHPHDAIDLIDHAASPLLKRAIPVVAGLVVLWVLWRVVRRPA